MRKPKHTYTRIGKILRRHHKKSKYIKIHPNTSGGRARYKIINTRITITLNNFKWNATILEKPKETEINYHHENPYHRQQTILKTTHTNPQTIIQELSKQGLQKIKAQILAHKI